MLKFVLFSVLMIVAPMVTFFATKKYFFEGILVNSMVPFNLWLIGDVMYSSVAALAAVNIVLLMFVIVAFLEDSGPADAPAEKAE